MKIDITPDTAGMFRFSIAILGSLTKIPKGEKEIIKEMLSVGLKQTQYIKEQNELITELRGNDD